MTSNLREAAVRKIDLGSGKPLRYFSLAALAQAGFPGIARLPVSLRIVLESVLRNCDGVRIPEERVRAIAGWQPNAKRESEIPFTVGRIVLNCAAGIPLLGDLTAIRGAMTRLGYPPESVGPKVPVDMALDHTLTVDYYGTPDALQKNMELDVHRNEERYRFVKWAMQAYPGIRLFPPGSGILHQLNLEFLAPGCLIKDDVCYFDTLVGTDSHTCMIAGLGVVGWGVGGIEAESAMLGLPVYFLTPDVVGVHVTGQLRQGVTATDMVLHVTEMMRRAKVVGAFVEFFGEGVAQLTVPDRATIANMAVEYGASIGYFTVDEQTCRYLRETGRPVQAVHALETYFRAQGCFGAPKPGEVEYSRVLELDLDAIVPCVAGPKRPQDRIELQDLKPRFTALLAAPAGTGGFGKGERPAGKSNGACGALHDGDVVIAAITSCTNTSNPNVMLAAGLLAKKAVERGLRSKPWVKTSLTPGSRVVSSYLEANGLQAYLDQLGFAVAGYSCATCVGASGPIDATLETDIADNDLIACAVLSGNRNFEARIHPAVKAAFLASPPLVVAFALAGKVGIDLLHDPLGTDPAGQPVYLREIWPTQDELAAALRIAANPTFYRDQYSTDVGAQNPLWAAIPQAQGRLYSWEADSTYIKEPPFLEQNLRQSSLAEIRNARPLAILGDSVTTDHISPIGSIKSSSPAGVYLKNHQVAPADFNNYGARRMNHDVMVRGAFSNLRLKNAMVPGVEGGVTVHYPSGQQMSIYDAAMRYAGGSVPLVIVAGEEYGTGSARDWAAKGTRLLGVRAVIASSFERIHRSNLVGMGVLPFQFPAGANAATLRLVGSELLDLLGIDDLAQPRQATTLRICRADGKVEEMPVTLRLDTQPEIEYVRCGGMMPFVLQEMVKSAAGAA
jgi:aconitate hydratase